MIIATVIFIFGLLSSESSSLAGKKVCGTPECRETAKRVLESLDNNVDPCHDFYRFACGSAINKTVIPDDKVKIDNFDIINEKINEQLYTMMEAPAEKNTIKPFELVKKFYQACMNETLIEEKGVKVILDLYEGLGGWPVLKGDLWNDEQITWTKLMADFRKMGLNTDIFLELTVDPDPTNSSVYIVELDQPVFGLPREYLVTNTHIEPYLDLMVNIAVQLGANRIEAKKELKKSLEFQINLANISLPSEERRNITKLVHHMSIKELQTHYPKTPWLEYINNILLPEVPLTVDDVILVVVPTYFSAFEDLIEKTPKRVQANYALWRATQDIISLLSKDLYQHFEIALQNIAGQAQRPPRWRECVTTVSDKLPILVSSLYVRKYFDQETKKHALEMVGYLKNAFKDILKGLDWMDEETRQKALDKANKITDHIGYPDQLLDDKLLESYFGMLETYADEYLKSYLNTKIHQTNKKFSYVFKLVDKNDWTQVANAAEVGASYRPLQNSIFFPAGILQGTFFNKTRPRYMNFGAIGTIIGHEITHGFDDEGKQFGSDGNLLNWWDPKTEESFLSKAQCIIDQYGNYTVPEVNMNINGIKTQGENIADNGGLKEAYLAYTAWVKQNSEEPKLAGLEEYSPQQLFWISAGMNWCDKSNSEYAKTVVAVDKHSPPEFRVVGPFSNSEQFAIDFKCPSGSRMNPVNKCAVW